MIRYGLVKVWFGMVRLVWFRMVLQNILNYIIMTSILR